MTASELKETRTNGGPLLVVTAEGAATWGGTDNGDYDRACSPSDYRNLDDGAIGGVTIGDGWGLALDMELITTFLPTPEGGVILRNYEDRPITHEAAGDDVSDDHEWSPWGSAWTLQDGRIFLFDSAFPGAASADAIEADDAVLVAQLAPRTYGIDTTVTEEGVELLRLRLQS